MFYFASFLSKNQVESRKFPEILREKKFCIDQVVVYDVTIQCPAPCFLFFHPACSMSSCLMVLLPKLTGSLTTMLTKCFCKHVLTNTKMSLPSEKQRPCDEFVGGGKKQGNLLVNGNFRAF